jgi:hypothetical protein
MIKSRERSCVVSAVWAFGFLIIRGAAETSQIGGVGKFPKFCKVSMPLVESRELGVGNGCDHEQHEGDKKAQWAINVSTLEDLSGCHSKAVRDYLDSTEGRLQVTGYNLQKGFGFQHNRGKGKVKVSDFVRW